jgi:hypothetical protein
MFVYPLPALVQMDTRTGATRSLDGLQRCIGKEGDAYNLTFSPDGQRALWGGQPGNDLAVSSAPLNGSSVTRRGPKPGAFWVDASNPIWLPDSRHWVQLLAGDHSLYAVVEGVDAPGVIRQVPIGSPKGTMSGFDLMRTRLLGCTPTGRVLATPDGFDDYRSPGTERKINFFEFSVDGGPARLKQYTIGLPKAGEGYDGDIALSPDEEVALSPRGDRLAWLVRVPAPEEQLPLWQRLSQGIPTRRSSEPRPRAQPLIELRTSRLDGGDMKVIGYMEPERDTKQPAKGVPYGLHWLPDGQHVSFLYDGALWTVAPAQ